MVQGAHVSPASHFRRPAGNLCSAETPNIIRGTQRDAYAPRSVRRVVNWWDIACRRRSTRGRFILERRL